MKALVEDWRSKWGNRTDGASDASFAFGWVQLNSNGPAARLATNPANVPGPGDPLGAWTKGFTGVRWAQTAALALHNTFQAVSLDTPAINGWVHSPFKQAVGARLARAALGAAYGKPQPSPSVLSARYVHTGDAHTMVVTLGGLGVPPAELQVRDPLGFELLSHGVWHSAPIRRADGATLLLDASNASAATGLPPAALRYLWYTTPCTMQPYSCPVYARVPPIAGGESGEMEYLPLAPCVMNVTSAPVPAWADGPAPAPAPAQNQHQHHRPLDQSLG